MSCSISTTNQRWDSLTSPNTNAGGAYGLHPELQDRTVTLYREKTRKKKDCSLSQGQHQQVPAAVFTIWFIVDGRSGGHGGYREEYSYW